MKFCKDCAHAHLTDEWRCHHPAYGFDADLVTGNAADCKGIRKWSNGCGIGGLFWEERPKLDVKEIPVTRCFSPF
jgi:hypothetical protein